MSMFLVTGAAGFIGSHLVEHLLVQGHKVVGLDNLSTGSRNNLGRLLNDPRLVFIEGDIRDYPTAHRACAGVDYVLHQAALGSVPRSLANPRETVDVNVVGTLTMLQAAQAVQTIKRFVSASSSSIYGDVQEKYKVETIPSAPRSPYAASKAAVESLCSGFFHGYGLPTVSLRYSNVYGPRQRADGPYAAVVPRFIYQALRGDPLTIYGSGQATRDFTFVGDVVRANLLACAAGPAALGRAINVSTGTGTSVWDLGGRIVELVGGSWSGYRVDHQESRSGDVVHSVLDTGLARELLGYLPTYDLEDGLRHTVEVQNG